MLQEWGPEFFLGSKTQNFSPHNFLFPNRTLPFSHFLMRKSGFIFTLNKTSAKQVFFSNSKGLQVYYTPCKIENMNMMFIRKNRLFVSNFHRTYTLVVEYYIGGPTTKHRNCSTIFNLTTKFQFQIRLLHNAEQFCSYCYRASIKKTILKFNNPKSIKHSRACGSGLEESRGWYNYGVGQSFQQNRTRSFRENWKKVQKRSKMAKFPSSQWSYGHKLRAVPAERYCPGEAIT